MVFSAYTWRAEDANNSVTVFMPTKCGKSILSELLKTSATSGDSFTSEVFPKVGFISEEFPCPTGITLGECGSGTGKMGVIAKEK